MYTEKDHTFVICAYKENPWLERTIQSIMKQTKKSRVILSTSTPNEHIGRLCQKYDIPCFVNREPVGIGGDWNYGYAQTTTPLVTVAHQDDLYEPGFLEETLRYINRRKKGDVIIAYTDYYEVKLGKKVMTNTLLKIKRLMNLPMVVPLFWGNRWVRRRILSMGDPICCPSVTFVRENAGEDIFDTSFRNSCDYKAWADLSRKKGSFVYVPKPLMAHRIYAESTTTENLNENIRQKEDITILREFWPEPIAGFINKIYSKSEASNIVN